MPREQTTNYDLWKPEVGSVGTPQWSEDLNTDMDLIDAALQDIQDQIDVLAPDAPVGLTERLENTERMLKGKRTIRRISINTSVTVDLDAGGDAIWITATGSGSKVVTFQFPVPDQTVDGTTDGTFVMQEGQLIVQNIGSGSISYVGLDGEIDWQDGDGAGISNQSTPGGQLRFYRWLLWHSADSSDSPPTSRMYLWRVAV